MNDAIFRKAALDRLSSPEQLDQVMRVTAAKDWLALIAIFLMLGMAGLWAYKGTIATKVQGRAVIVRAGGIIAVTSTGSGQILRVPVKAGDKIKAGQLVAAIAQPALLDRIRSMEESLAQVRSDGNRNVEIKAESAKLQAASIARQRSNLEREIKELEEQSRLASEQVPIEEELLAKGLVVKRQVIEQKQKLVAIEAEIARHKAQLTQSDAQRYTAESEPGQARVEAHARAAELERRLAELRHELTLSTNVTTSYGGEVVEVKVQPGGAVTAGATLLTIQPPLDTLEGRLFVASERAKEVVPGMRVEISPGGVKREEFGYMIGTVMAVAGFPATQAALLRSFENDAIVAALTSGGPVTEMRVQLRTDPATPSGFRWSSSRGPELRLSPGTLCDAAVATREQRPAALALPFLREKLGL